MALRSALLLVALLFSALPCSATTTCPGITSVAYSVVTAGPVLLSAAMTPYSATNPTCNAGDVSVGRAIRFTPPSTANFSIHIELIEAGMYVAVEVRQGSACAGPVVACKSGVNSVGWDALQLTANQPYSILIFPNATYPPSPPPASTYIAKLWVDRLCELDNTNTVRSVNITLSSLSTDYGRVSCGSTTDQTMHMAQFSPAVSGLYSVIVRKFNGGRGAGASFAETRGFLQIVPDSCGAASSSSTAAVYCVGSDTMLGPEAIHLQQGQVYTVRVGNRPFWSNGPVALPDNTNVLEVRYVSDLGGGPAGTCLDYPVPVKTAFQTYQLSPASLVHVDFTCDNQRSSSSDEYDGIKLARYASYTPKVTGDHFIRAFRSDYSSSSYDSPLLTIEVHAHNCQGANVGCATYYSTYYSSYNRYVGLSSVRLYSNTTYVIIVGDARNQAFSTYYSVGVEVGLVSAYLGESPDRCTDNALVSTPYYQSTVLSTRYALEEKLTCEFFAQREGLYVSFRAPFTGNYFARVRNPTTTLGVEVRHGRCGGASAGCSMARSSSQVAATGLDRVYMETGRWYVIHVNPRSYRNVVAGNTLELGYCGNMCAYTDGHNSDGDQDVDAATKTFGSVANVIQYNLATVVTPAVFFLVALVLGLWFCLKDRAAAHAVDRVEGGVPMAVPHGAASLLIPLHRQCFACAVLAVGVWVSGWAVFWSVMAYPLSVLVCVYAIRIVRMSPTEHAFAVSRFARESTKFQWIFIVSGVLLLGNAVVAFAQAGLQMTDGLAFCNEFYAGSQACIASVTLNPVYGVLAAVAMVALGVCSIRLGHLLHSIAETTRSETMRRAFGGDVPEAEVVREPHANQPQPATVVTFRTQPQQQPEQQHGRETVLAEEVADVHEDALCQICSDARTSRTFYKCGHRTCAACADKIMRTVHKKCPFCNQPIKDVIAYF